MRRVLESEKEWSCVTKCGQLMLSACLPSKHAGSDPEAFWLRLVMAVTASVRSESGRIVYAGSDFPHPIQLRFSKEGMDHIVWTDLDPIWVALSGFGETHLVWKQVGMQQSSGPVSGRRQPARYQFSTFRLGCNHPQTSWIILCKTSPDQNQPGSKPARIKTSPDPI